MVLISGLYKYCYNNDNVKDVDMIIFIMFQLWTYQDLDLKQVYYNEYLLINLT